jgi:hypothetical protein
MSSASDDGKSQMMQGDTEKVENVDVVDMKDFQDADAEFGGTEERKKLERKLLWKIDLRMSILTLIYILNFVSCAIRSLDDNLTTD